MDNYAKKVIVGRILEEVRAYFNKDDFRFNNDRNFWAGSFDANVLAGIRLLREQDKIEMLTLSWWRAMLALLKYKQSLKVAK